MGRSDEALEGYHEALALCRDVGHRRQEAAVLTNMGRHHLRLGELEAAELRLREAAELVEAHGYGGDLRLGLLNNLGVVAAELGRDDVPELLAPALKDARELRDRRMESVILTNLAAHAHSRGRFAEAEEHYRAALEGFGGMGDPLNAALAGEGLAVLLQATGRSALAIELLEQRMADHDTWPESMESHLWARMGAALADLGRVEEASQALG